MVPGLFVLPCGPLPPNPAELLTSPRFKEVLDELRAQYDFVLVDTPPLLAVTDPCVVAPRVDGVVLTMRMSKKSRPKAERAREILSTLGVKVLGVVVNGVTAEQGRASTAAASTSTTTGRTITPAPRSSRRAAITTTRPARAEPCGRPPRPKPPSAAAERRSSPAGRRRSRQGVWRLPLLAWVLGWWA